MPTSILLIGPIGAGKSTQGTLLAEALGLPRRPLDDLRWDYYREIGYDEALAKQIMERDGFLGLYRYWKPFEVHAVERVLADHPNDSVIDFGAGHSVFEDEVLFSRAQQALARHENVVLLLPSPHLDESVRLPNERNGGVRDNGFDCNEHFVKHPSNHALATLVIYTNGKTPEETCGEILSRIGRDRIQSRA